VLRFIYSQRNISDNKINEIRVVPEYCIACEECVKKKTLIRETILMVYRGRESVCNASIKKVGIG